jgi:hypothetical protein
MSRALYRAERDPRGLATRLILATFAALVGCTPEAAPDRPRDEAPPRPVIDWAPRSYVARPAATPIRVDGKLDDSAWRLAPWTEAFIDIEGSSRPPPPLLTRAKVLWSEEALWIGAELEEPHVWGTLTERDDVIYLDDDFEVFLDPDGDTHAYYELEINALGTEWDLFLARPYRDGGPAIHAWDIPGLRTAVSVDGTLNQPEDMDRGWSVEIAIPWAALAEATEVPVPPRPGDRWRLNFSRVDWPVEIRDGRTVKRVDPGTGDTAAESNWVWSPQGLIAMHYPEMWGFLIFAGAGDEAEVSDAGPLPEERAGWFLRQVYFGQHEHRARIGSWASDPKALDIDDDFGFELAGLATTPNGFEAWVELDGGSTIRIDEEGRVRISP